ncbi:hypothetical protein EIN_502110 [Entamoeba invadens IP1]|uniref:Leucine rich repeat containing protein BspA family protein n=1 Tax=Entamoeba invadens IP1 TaxID=370355 RepID=A0A0A1TV01_ENTIV|nr:hypothetical protein EIN_502110 [Entamoeba invadens IP1]ELP84098.1 hypothetical protein EIN_502110 [Entamoeba invadens IP1]|eukprot:XP_004183444.1 hypothetical protein EIN_502110 [Entamoeba invadens IP1]
MSKLDTYHIMVVSKYFETIGDFIKLETVCKKYKNTMKKFHYNPVPVTDKTINYFSKIETLYLYHKEDEILKNLFLINTPNSDYCEKTHKPKNKGAIKKYYRIIVWFNVDFTIVDKNKKYKNVIFKNVTYTKHDRETFGDTIPLIVKSIGEKCFYFNTTLINLTVPSNVTLFGDYCFCHCKNLVGVILQPTVTKLSYGCFAMCEELKSIEIPLSVVSIGDYCFFECYSLINITITSNVKSIGFGCFGECYALTTVNIFSLDVSIDSESFPINTEVHYIY